jgi:hypothetical protein
MTTKKILGVDPGIRGGLAVVLIYPPLARPLDNTIGLPGADTDAKEQVIFALRDWVRAQLLDAIDIPVVGTGAKERIDIVALRHWVRAQQPVHALIERAQAMPRQGSSSGFKYGRAVGAIEAVIVGCAVPLTIIEPTAWKKFHGLASALCNCFRMLTRCSPASVIMVGPKRR